MHKNDNNNSRYFNGGNNKYVRVSECRDFIALKTVNGDWCVINTRTDMYKGMKIVKNEPFASCKVMLMHLSDFDSLFPGLQEIPETIKWPLQQYNDSRSN